LLAPLSTLTHLSALPKSSLPSPINIWHVIPEDVHVPYSVTNKGIRPACYFT
jgi:hypothetical protein